MRKFLLWFGATILICAAIAGIVVGGQAAGFWLNNRQVNNDTKITYHGLANQSALRSQIHDQINQVDKYTSQIASAKAQGYKQYAESLYAPRYDSASTVCDDISQLTDPGSLPVFTNWGKKNCNNGTVSPSSVYYISQ